MSDKPRRPSFPLSHKLSYRNVAFWPQVLTSTIEEEILMTRKLGLLFGVLLIASIPAGAQQKMEVFGGYSYMRFNSSPGADLNGWEISGQYKFTDWLGGSSGCGRALRLAEGRRLVGIHIPVWPSGVIFRPCFAFCALTSWWSSSRCGGIWKLFVFDGDRGRHRYGIDTRSSLAHRPG